MKVIRFVLFLLVFITAMAIIDIAFKLLFVLGFASVANLANAAWYWLLLAIVPLLLMLAMLWYLLKALAVYSVLLISRISPYNNKVTTISIDWIVLLNTIYLIYGAWTGVEGKFNPFIIALCIVYTLCSLGLFGAFIRASKALDTILIKRELNEIKKMLV